MHVMSFNSYFEMFIIFLGKYSVNCSEASKSTEDNKWARDFKWIGSDGDSWTFWGYFMRTSIYGVVNLTENYSFVVSTPYYSY